MNSGEMERIEKKLPWVKDWDPRRPSYSGDKKYSEDKCRATKVRDDLDVILKSNFTVIKGDIHSASFRATSHRHRWFLKNGAMVYYVCNLPEGITIHINSSSKPYGLGSVVDGVNAAVERNKRMEEIRERSKKEAEESREARRKQQEAWKKAAEERKEVRRKLEEAQKEAMKEVRRKLEEEQRKKEELERSWRIASTVCIPGIAEVGKTEAGQRLISMKPGGIFRPSQIKEVLRLLGQVFSVFEQVI